MVAPDAAKVAHDLWMMKLSQIVMLGIGFLAIWGGVFSVAFDENATNDNFLVLFVGGVASFLVSIGFIELQSKNNDRHLYDVQNYALGTAFFFSTVGVLWGTRYLMGVATGTLEWTVFGDPALYTESDWSPNANGIYAQTATALLLTYGHFRLLNRYKGDTSFGWGVATYAPMAILLAGVGPWISWSNNVVSWELGIGILVMTWLSLEMSLRSDRALNFVVIAFTAGLVPIVYELLNTEAPTGGEGGALSLLVFIVAMQGAYAARTDLRKEVMERASLLLVGQVVLAMALVRNMDYNLILGPLRFAEHEALAPYVDIAVALWCTLLLAYFPAVVQQRVPWMPVGLAVALFVIPTETSTVPWVLAMVMLPYMVFVSKVARAWVVNLTLLAFSAAYLLTDWLAILQDTSTKDAFGGTYLHIAIPLFIIAMAEGARMSDKVRMSTTLGMLAAVILSRAILDPEWYLPWLLVAYMIVANLRVLNAHDGSMVQRKEATLSLGFTGLTVLVLGVWDKLQWPPYEALAWMNSDGFRPQLLLLSLIMYALSQRGKQSEYDLGSVLAWLSSGGENGPTYDQTTGVWVVQEQSAEDIDERINEGEWTPLARISMLASLTLFSLSVSALNDSVWSERPYISLVMVLPVIMLVRELVSMDKMTSKSRATAVGMLVFLAAPLSITLSETSHNVFLATVLLDAILVTAPLSVNAYIGRRGLDEEGLDASADQVMYALLLVLALLDTSGGLLFLPIMTLVAARTLMHRHYGLTVAVPLVWILGDDWWRSGLMDEVLTRLPADLTAFLVHYHLGAFPAFVGMLVMAHMGMTLLVMNTDREKEPGAAEVFALIWFALGMLSVLPDGYWIPTIFTSALMAYVWYTEKAQTLPYLLWAMFFSLYLGFAESEAFPSLSDGDAGGWSGLLAGVLGLGISLANTQGWLFRNALEDDEQQSMQAATSVLALQFAGVLMLLSFDVAYGVGPLFGIALVAWSVMSKGEVNGLLIFPPLFMASVINVMNQGGWGAEDQRFMVGGAVLMLQGMVITWLSTKDDALYDWDKHEWENDEEFFSFMDRLGMVSVIYTLIGLFMIFVQASLESVAYLLMTVYLIVLGIQGFDERFDARWRRGIGGYGSILMAFIFSGSLDSNIFRAVSMVMAGIVALGFGFLFMQRMNEDDAIYVDSTSPVEPHPPSSPSTEEHGDVVEQDDATMESDIEDMEALDDDTEGMNDMAAAPAAEATEHELSVEDEDDNNDAMEHVPAEQETTSTISAPSHSGLLATDQGFSVRLPEDAVNSILAALKSTPYDGFVPVVAFGPSGQIMLTFETREGQSS